MLGNKCNFRCKYCLQEGEFRKHSKEISSTPSEKLLSYIDKLISMKAYSTEKIEVIFWGGEPLLYIETIKKVVNYFKDKLNYAIISNGSLLNEEIVSFLNKYNFSFIVSNDGSNTKDTRIKNVLEDNVFCTLFKKIKKRSVTSVISAYNQDLQSLQNYIYSKVGKTDINFDLLIPSEALPKEAFSFNYKKFTESVVEMANEAAEDFILKKETPAVKFFRPFLNKISLADKNSSSSTSCGELSSSLSIDLNGNIYICHDSIRTVGDTNSSSIDIEMNHLNFLRRNNYKELKKCSSCFIEKYCQGDCKLITSKHRGIEACCELRRITYSAAFYLVEKLNNFFEKVNLSEEI